MPIAKRQLAASIRSAAHIPDREALAAFVLDGTGLPDRAQIRLRMPATLSARSERSRFRAARPAPERSQNREAGRDRPDFAGGGASRLRRGYLRAAAMARDDPGPSTGPAPAPSEPAPSRHPP